MCYCDKSCRTPWCGGDGCKEPETWEDRFNEFSLGKGWEARKEYYLILEDVMVIKDFIRIEIDLAKQEAIDNVFEQSKLHIQDALNNPMGVSQWAEHGKKYGYDKFYGIKWEEKI